MFARGASARAATAALARARARQWRHAAVDERPQRDGELRGMEEGEGVHKDVELTLSSWELAAVTGDVGSSGNGVLPVYLMFSHTRPGSLAGSRKDSLSRASRQLKSGPLGLPNRVAPKI